MSTQRLLALGAMAGALAFVVMAGSACAHKRYRFPPPVRPEVGYVQSGTASWYGPQHHGRRTSSGERFDMDGLTAAHRSFAFGTRVRVTLLSSGRSVVVRINDRFPNHKGRVIDLSRAAAREIGMMRLGTGRVRIEVVG
jgi:rare lipoprotein A